MVLADIVLKMFGQPCFVHVKMFVNAILAGPPSFYTAHACLEIPAVVGFQQTYYILHAEHYAL